MSHNDDASLNLDREQRLANLLVAVTEARRHGQSPDIEALCRQHPDLATDLQELLPLALMADGAGHGTKSGVKTQLPAYTPDTSTDSTPPRHVADYELNEELGRGGMGVVYKAWDERLQRNVALKMILRGEHASTEDLKRFRGESLAIGKLAHPNIVPVYDVGEQDSQAWFCMQFIDGITLAKRIDDGPLSSRQAAKYLLTICQAVHHAHEQGILHRDLKPANVLIDKHTDEPMVTDFGLAKRLSDKTSALVSGGLTGTGKLVGTPSYMAPEQASGQDQTTARSDVYSLGATLYEMLTGRPPFQAASVVDVLLQVRGEEPVRPRLLNSSIDPDLEFICLKCLEKQPEHRYRSADELAQDLQRYLNSEPVLARTSNLVYFFSRLIRETHHASVMENWGELWMWHSVMIILLCIVTNIMYLNGVTMHVPYLALWSIGLVVWGIFFWNWRRRGGPVLFVERQVAHAWAAGVVASIGTFLVEILLGREVLSLTPILAVMAGMVFIFKAGTLTGWFYIAACLCFLAVLPMQWFPDYAPLMFGIVSGFGFFVPGLRYYLQKRNASRRED